jgi:serine/threonine-protein kinase
MVLRGKYEILERVGRGGMATVYRARHRAFGEIRAIKVVGSTLADHDDFLRRFHQEAVVARKLHHPHAVRVEDLDTTDDGRPFIVMEYVDGRNLREVIRQEGALGVSRALRIAREIAAALAAAHHLGIIHRDIKPDNVLLSRAPDGTESAKVLDFGIAKVKEGAFETGAGYAPTQTGVVVGTPQYISPEQAMGKRGDEVDGRSDLYSLGVVLYEMVTGRLPFQSDTAMGLILHHLQTAPTPPHLVRPELALPPALSEVLMKALQKDRERRYASAEDMLAALESVPTTPTPPPGVRAAGTPPPLPLPLPLGIPTRSGEVPTPKPPPTLRGDIEELPTRAFPKGPETPVPPPTTVLPPPPITGAGTPPPRPRRARWRIPALILLAFFVLSRLAGRSRHAEPKPSPQPLPSVAQDVVPPEAGDETQAAVRDAMIQQEVRHALTLTPLTRDEPIDVEVEDGVVSLSGTVSRGVAAEVARVLASRVTGVKKVVSDLEVNEETVPSARPGRPNVNVPRPPSAPVVPFPIPNLPFPPRPGSPEAEQLRIHLDEGRAALDKGDGQAAIEAYANALSLDPTSGEAHSGMARAQRLIIGQHPEEQRPRGRRGRRSPEPAPQ